MLYDSSLFLDFYAFNHDEINRVLLVVLNSFIILFLIIAQSSTISIVHSSVNIKFTSSNNYKFQYVVYKFTQLVALSFLPGQLPT